MDREEPDEVKEQVQDPAPVEESPHASLVQVREWLAGMDLCKEELRGLDGQHVGHEPAVCSCGQEGQWLNGALKRMWPESQGRLFSRPSEARSGIPCPVLGSSAEE